jgi:hypothetical protein
MYTDGLVERRGDDFDRGVDRLARARGAVDVTTEAGTLAAQLLEACVSSPTCAPTTPW